MRDEKILRERLEQLRGQLLQWGTPDLMVFVTTKDAPRLDSGARVGPHEDKRRFETILTALVLTFGDACELETISDSSLRPCRRT